MPKIDLGPVGAVVSPGEDDFVDLAVALEQLGYTTVWLSGGPMRGLDQIAAVVRATRAAKIATGIIAVDRFPADEVGALYTELEASDPGRFVVGLGGAHGSNPLQTLNGYLDVLDAAGTVPVTSRVMAALGPRMVDLARDRASGAFPVLVTPGFAAGIRKRLGDDSTLAVEQLLVVDTDAERARAQARGPLGFLGQSPSYQASFRRMGFTDQEIAQLADRLVDALVPWGDADTVAARASEQLQAGADHVAISVVADPAAGFPLDQWRAVAAAFGLGLQSR
jgi:probable F420-dependent oxidoreductase